VSENGLPRGPSAPTLVQTLRWLVAPIELMESCRRRYGDAFSLTFLGFGSPMVLLSDPEVLRELYSGRPAAAGARNAAASGEHTLPPGRTVSLLPIMGAGSLLLLEGAEHLERRRLMLPPFHGERLRAYETAIREIAVAEVDRWRGGESFAVHERMRAITLEAILRVVFGVTDEGRLTRLRELVPQLMADTSSLSLSFRVLLAQRLGRVSPLEHLGGLREEIDLLLFAEIAERRALGVERDDVLSLLLAARFEDGSAIGDRELRDHLVTLLLAGHETTATALAWTFELLLRNRGALETLLASLEEGDDSYLRAVISESLRLRSRPRRRRPSSPGRDGRDAGDLADAHAPRPLPRAVRISSRALPRQHPTALRLDPVRRRRAALPRRRLRGARDADRDRDRAVARRAFGREPRRGADRAPQRHVRAAARRSRPRAAPPRR